MAVRRPVVWVLGGLALVVALGVMVVVAFYIGLRPKDGGLEQYLEMSALLDEEMGAIVAAMDHAGLADGAQLVAVGYDPWPFDRDERPWRVGPSSCGIPLWKNDRFATPHGAMSFVPGRAWTDYQAAFEALDGALNATEGWADRWEHYVPASYRQREGLVEKNYRNGDLRLLVSASSNVEPDWGWAWFDVEIRVSERCYKLSPGDLK